MYGIAEFWIFYVFVFFDSSNFCLEALQKWHHPRGKPLDGSTYLRPEYYSNFKFSRMYSRSALLCVSMAFIGSSEI